MATTMEALPKSVVVADSVGKARPSSFLLRSASEPHLNYMFAKYEHLSGSESLEFSPSSSRSPSPNGKDESIFSNHEDDTSSISTTGSSTPKRPAPVLERRHTFRGGETLRHSFSSSSSLPSLKSKKRPTSVAFMRAPISEGQVVTMASHRSNSSGSLSSLGNNNVRKDELWLGFKTLESDYSK
ncbi:hypothetical protein ABW19_dt0200927 [Dactylella cylindrospora]|nr:hypothetical protein ABW19_dt0200927 [Dactylella cylindrospora]